MSELNLVPRSRQRELLDRRRRKAWTRGLAVFAPIAILCAASAHVPATADGRELGDEMRRQDARLMAAQERLSGVRDRLTQVNRELAAAKALGEHPDWSALLEAIARLRQGEIVLDSVELGEQTLEAAADAAQRPGQNGVRGKGRRVVMVTLGGLSIGPTNVFNYALRLEGLKVAERVGVKETRPQAIGSLQGTRFQIEMVLPAQAEPRAKDARGRSTR